MLVEFGKHLEEYLNGDVELERRLAGFKTFAGLPDGHFTRARKEGISAVARAVRCYPFGGKSRLKAGEILGIGIVDAGVTEHLVVLLEENAFSIRTTPWDTPPLTITLPKPLFVKTLLGRHRWLWTMGMDDVQLTHSHDLPHSDWVTILEILVTMQELIEFKPELWHKVENF